WREPGDAIEDIILAIDKMDRAGYHGPYRLGLSSSLYNRLFRRYPQGNTLELDHLRTLVTEGVVKMPDITSGGILLAYGRQFASVAIGQDLSTGFEGPSGRSYTFVVSESVALWLRDAGAVCVLQEAGGTAGGS
ncbi:MAG: bacteriocin, partial [Chitinivibrionales bacterium]|nr:bacteriocin [Chitinivibrionales bacterium]